MISNYIHVKQRGVIIHICSDFNAVAGHDKYYIQYATVDIIRHPYLISFMIVKWARRCKLRVIHDDVIKWKHFPRYWPFVRGIHRWPVVRGIHRWPMDSPHEGQWRGALMLSFNCAWTNGWAKNRDTGDLRRLCALYDATAMSAPVACSTPSHHINKTFSSYPIAHGTPFYGNSLDE